MMLRNAAVMIAVVAAIALLVVARQSTASKSHDNLDRMRDALTHCSVENGSVYLGLLELCERALSERGVAKALEDCVPCELTGEGANGCLGDVTKILWDDPRTSNLKQLARSANAVAEIQAACADARL